MTASTLGRLFATYAGGTISPLIKTKYRLNHFATNALLFYYKSAPASLFAIACSDVSICNFKSVPQNNYSLDFHL